MVIGKQVEVLGLARNLIKDTNGLYPGTLLGIIDFTQVKQGLLVRMPTPGNPHIFDDAEVAMLFAVFLSLGGAQKHNLAPVCQTDGGTRQGGKSSLQPNPAKLTPKTSLLQAIPQAGPGKIVKIASSIESRASIPASDRYVFPVANTCAWFRQ